MALVVLLSTLSAGAATETAAREPIACGPAALSLSARLLDRPVSRERLAAAFGDCLSGVHSLEQISEAGERLGLLCRPVRHDPRHGALARLPLIVPVQRSPHVGGPQHFVVLYSGNDRTVQVLDFPRETRLVPREEFARNWSGEGLYVAAHAEQLEAVPSASTDYGIVLLLAAALIVGMGTYRLFGLAARIAEKAQ